MSDLRDRIELWKQRLAAVTTNANELSDMESTLRVRARQSGGQYSGLTRERAARALGQLDALMRDYLLLARVVDEADQVERTGMFTSRETKAEKIDALLSGPSIVRSTSRVPIAKRSLLASPQAQDTMTPDQLLGLMQDAFADARDGLAEIDQVQLRVDEDLRSLRQDFALVAARANGLQANGLQAAADGPSFIEIPNLQSDPLNAQAGMEALRRNLVTWNTKLDAMERARAESQAGVRSVRSALAELERLAARFQEKRGAVKNLLGDEAAATLRSEPAAQLGMLTSWCETLESSLAAGQWQAVAVGTSRIGAALATAISSANASVADAQARCAEVEDIQGRFSALKVKDDRLSQATDADTVAATALLRRQIDAALKSRPLELGTARARVAAYQEMLLSRGPH